MSSIKVTWYQMSFSTTQLVIQCIILETGLQQSRVHQHNHTWASRSTETTISLGLLWHMACKISQSIITFKFWMTVDQLLVYAMTEISLRKDLIMTSAVQLKAGQFAFKKVNQSYWLSMHLEYWLKRMMIFVTRVIRSPSNDLQKTLSNWRSTITGISLM